MAVHVTTTSGGSCCCGEFIPTSCCDDPLPITLCAKFLPTGTGTGSFACDILEGLVLSLVWNSGVGVWDGALDLSASSGLPAGSCVIHVRTRCTGGSWSTIATFGSLGAPECVFSLDGFVFGPCGQLVCCDPLYLEYLGTLVCANPATSCCGPFDVDHGPQVRIIIHECGTLGPCGTCTWEWSVDLGDWFVVPLEDSCVDPCVCVKPGFSGTIDGQRVTTNCA